VSPCLVSMLFGKCFRTFFETRYEAGNFAFEVIHDGCKEGKWTLSKVCGKEFSVD
jgi:hypothetical protein